MLYRNLSGYLKEKYGGPVSKICIDGGFSCPNRDGRCGVGGCIFCGERGAGEHIVPGVSIRRQVEDFFSKPHRAAAGYIAYFQNFTNTYAPVDVLRARYDEALCDPRIVALAVGTRPDCVDEAVAHLLAGYRSRCDVWVELGLQTANDEIGRRVRRGYDSTVFAQAVHLLHAHGIPVVAHVLIGLPGEQMQDVLDTAHFLHDLPVWGIKIHSLYIMKGTVLAEWYRAGRCDALTLDEYVARAAALLARVRPDVVVHRLTGDCPAGRLVAPEWNRDKSEVLRRIVCKMEENGWTQGCLYGAEKVNTGIKE